MYKIDVFLLKIFLHKTFPFLIHYVFYYVKNSVNEYFGP